MNTPLLKLRAGDSEDLQIISAVLQDSIVPVCDMAFQAQEQNFVMVAQRLRREAGDTAERICCALTIKNVTSVQTQGIDLRHSDRMLDLLAVLLEAETSQITLVFAGNARLRLASGAWVAALEDFGEPWPAQCKPCHEQAG